jgi:ABC-type dipeptide/oligopeptide/nickel transport system permease component
MKRFLARRAGQALITLIASSMVIFGLLRLIPGDPANMLAGGDSSPQVVTAIRHQLGLDRPVPVQYWSWLTGVLHGNFGISLSSKGPVTSLIGPSVLPTALMVTGGVALAIVVAFVLGIGAAVTRRPSVDAGITAVASVLYGAPAFWLALLAVLLFSVKLGWLPAGGYADPFQYPVLGLRSLALPWAVLAVTMGAALSRFVRTAFREALVSDHVRMVAAKGASPGRILFRHVFRNALIPVVTVFGVAFAALLGGAVVLETVFAWPGMGSLLVNSVSARDYPTVQALLLFYVSTFVVINLMTDVSYSLIDPRIRLS